ncbi:MAG: hypothetical protein ACI9XO_001102 [Paraglaciecola sp.]
MFFWSNILTLASSHKAAILARIAETRDTSATSQDLSIDIIVQRSTAHFKYFGNGSFGDFLIQVTDQLIVILLEFFVHGFRADRAT